MKSAGMHQGMYGLWEEAVEMGNARGTRHLRVSFTNMRNAPLRL